MLNSNKDKLLYLLSQTRPATIKLLASDFLIQQSLNNKNDSKFTSTWLKENQYFLLTASAVDQPSKFNRFSLLYVYGSYFQPQHIYVQQQTSLQAQSIHSIFPSAIWLEREIFDMFGILFVSDNNSAADLRRILTDYHFKGHPFRKDFSLIGFQEKFYTYRKKTIQNNMWPVY